MTHCCWSCFTGLLTDVTDDDVLLSAAVKRFITPPWCNGTSPVSAGIASLRALSQTSQLNAHDSWFLASPSATPNKKADVSLCLDGHKGPFQWGRAFSLALILFGNYSYANKDVHGKPQNNENKKPIWFKANDQANNQYYINLRISRHVDMPKYS